MIDHDIANLKLLQHTTQWSKCQRCPLGEDACNHVLGRGYVPATTIFMGTGPGNPEDKSGRPFAGFGGRLINKLAKACLYNPNEVYITNALACRAFDPANPSMLRAPSRIELEACRSRIIELIDICNPKLMVFVSQIAESFYAEFCDGCGLQWISLKSIGSMIANGGFKSPEYGDSVERLRNFVQNNFGKGKRP